MTAQYRILIRRIAPGRKSSKVYSRVVRRILNREVPRG